MLRLATGAATFLVILAFPVVFTGTAVRLLFSWQPLYEYSFDRYRVAVATGIDRADLSRVAQALIAYFNNEEPTVNLSITQRGTTRDVFTEREVLHMVDVKALVRGVVRAQEIAFFVVIAFIAIAAWRERVGAARRVGTAMLWGSGLTFALLAALLALSLADFETLFLQFHVLSFQGNDYWLLDPRIHNLIAMFPPPFWFDATLLLGMSIALQAAIVLLAGWQLRRFFSPAALPAASLACGEPPAERRR
ncbi:MAG: TIGR01906 family membrane protein [Chloroflexota bacterium]|nr:TIGR01906 family membrane protein [Dehalococcoidia bacterium]MDW8255040.1 TIGR01906 family membrane protein [Chloroflexota bacterium]